VGLLFPLHLFNRRWGLSEIAQAISQTTGVR
jgi:hypothetical protein